MNYSIMVVAYAFAPCTLVGAARMTSLVDYLCRQGNKVTVFSQGKSFYENDRWTRIVPQGIKHIEIEKTVDTDSEFKTQIENELQNSKYDVCLTSMGPYDTQKYLWRICEKHNVPLILDYRDPWLFSSYYYHGSSFTIKVKKIIYDLLMWHNEKNSVKYASAVVSVTEKNTETLQKRYGMKDKFHTIYNGHDDLSFIINNGAKRRKEYCIGCIGKFFYYDEKYAKSLLRILDALNGEGYRVKLFHAGEKNDEATEFIKSNGINHDIYEYVGKLDYSDAMRLLNEMNAALIIYKTKEGLGTKVFDYIGLDKPIIYYGILPSELAEFISKFDNVVVESDEDRLMNAVKEFVRNPILSLGNKDIGFYSRSNQNTIYERLLIEVIKGYDKR